MTPAWRTLEQYHWSLLPGVLACGVLWGVVRLTSHIEELMKHLRLFIHLSVCSCVHTSVPPPVPPSVRLNNLNFYFHLQTHVLVSFDLDSL